MHTNPNQVEDRQVVTISGEEAAQFIKRLNKFKTKFQQMQQDFQQSADTTYYIVSVKFINQWRQFIESPELSRLSPHPMNENLYQNGKFKLGLVQKADFEIVNEEIFKLFEPFTDKTKVNKRQATLIGKQKRVPVYLSAYKYIAATYEMLKAIDFNRKSFEQFVIKDVDISSETKLQNVMSTLKELEQLPSYYECRLWVSEKSLTRQSFYKLIKSELKPCSIATYKIQGVGKRLDDLTAKISDLIIDENAFFILQAKTYQQKFVFIKDGQGRCEGCNAFGTLDFPCGCNKVKYCSEKCMEKDKVYHVRNCAYAEQMELNTKVQMTVSSDSRNGLVGLNNLGNTCFMNSCLQCLSNTRPLTDYFLKGYFEAEINKINPIGTKGKLAKNYAKFIKGMWCQNDKTYSPHSVKNAVSDINPMFSGYAQHDSQQFFSFLVDGLHEDLNRVQSKPYVEAIQEQNKSDSQIAVQSWIKHLKRNQSIITDTMSGQYRSIVVCPDCQHKSTTFDPFITLTLPIPQSNEKSTDFFQVCSNMQKKNKRAWFKYSNKNPDHWNKAACEAVGTDISKCNLYVVSFKENIYKVGRQSMSEIINKIQNQAKNMFLIEQSEQELAVPKQNVVQFTSRISKKAYSSSSQDVFFKLPMIFDKTSLTGLCVTKRYLSFLYGQAYNESKNRKTFGWGSKNYEDYEKQFLKDRPFKILLRVGKKPEISYQRLEITYKKEIQVQDDTNIMELLANQDININDCQLDARFQKGKSFDFNFQKLKDFDTVGKQPRVDKNNAEVPLEKCFENFSTPQTLEAGNEWYCPKCKEHKLAKKTLSIYRAPKVLIIHLKRFKQKGNYKKQKNQSLVLFPQQLSMQEYLINPSPIQNYLHQINQTVFIPPKAEGLSLARSQNKAQPKYKLFAVSNHYGGLGGGHYTAYGKNGQQWYQFDDSSVSTTNLRNVISSGAYLLFYQRID